MFREIIPNQIPNPEDKDESLRVRNEMQIKLAERRLGAPLSDEQMLQWIKKESPAFGSIVEEYPLILDLYKENPDEALKIVDDMLYNGKKQA